MSPHRTADPDQASGRGRVSQNAPEFVSPTHDAWDDALSDPRFVKSLDAGRADVEAGRTRPWTKVRRKLAV